ncbi:Multidrug resistance protein MdtE [Vibrio stylophorae]|uniref:Multidrug resistance protein MdtE n=1 Tax=Vibrio stylophorae TaxID=659351 RepID=A0ABM8ZUJ8_9VIBR|nr:efflux RND transporter periplasmic adaptor subunit [Vibrio stylophorae]CAH0533992.1 Multidrug resistance protein MdtE [Vibrio stylophorae]
MLRTKRFARSGLLLLSAFYLSACGEPAVEVQPEVKQARPAVIETVQLSTVADLSYHGVVRSAERADLAFRLSGKLVEMTVEEGDSVQAGQVLAKLDQRQLQIALNSARTELKKAQADYSRGRKIFESSQAISKSDLEQLQTKRDLAKNRFQDAQRNIEDATLRAPFDGVIARKLANNFNQVQANQVIYSLQNLNQLEVVIDVPSQKFLANRDSHSTLAYGYVEGLADVAFPLQFKYFASDADPLTQTYEVVLGFTDLKSRNVLPGMTVRVASAQEEKQGEGVISVPLIAVQPNNMGEQYVWVVDDQGFVIQRTVTVGQLVGDRVVIDAGLKAGERVITVAANSVQPGMQVYPLKTEGE